MKTIPYKTDAEWHALRAQNVGASESAGLLHCQAEYQMSAYTLWHVKSGRIDPPDVKGERVKWGKRLEQVIAEAACEEYGWQSGAGGYVVHPTLKGMACTLDHVIFAGPEAEQFGGPGCLEVKNTDWLIHRRQWTEDEPPVHIIVQLQHQLACADYDWGVVVSLVGGNRLERYVYERRPKLIGAIENRIAEFWKSIEADEQPGVDNSTSAAATLKTLYGQAINGKAFDFTQSQEFSDRVYQLNQARLDKKASEANERAAANWILNEMGEAEVGVSDGVEILTAKTSQRKGFTVEPTTCRTIRLKEI